MNSQIQALFIAVDFFLQTMGVLNALGDLGMKFRSAGRVGEVERWGGYPASFDALFLCGTEALRLIGRCLVRIERAIGRSSANLQLRLLLDDAIIFSRSFEFELRNYRSALASEKEALELFLGDRTTANRLLWKAAGSSREKWHRELYQAFNKFEVAVKNLNIIREQVVAASEDLDDD